MLHDKLLTATTHPLPIEVVVFNNSSLVMVRLEMPAVGVSPFGTDHNLVDSASHR